LWTSNRSLLLVYLSRKDERLSRPGWLTYSGRFTYISGHLSAASRAQDRGSSPVKDQGSTTVPYNQPGSQPKKQILMYYEVKMSHVTTIILTVFMTVNYEILKVVIVWQLSCDTVIVNWFSIRYNRWTKNSIYQSAREGHLFPSLWLRHWKSGRSIDCARTRLTSPLTGDRRYTE